MVLSCIICLEAIWLINIIENQYVLIVFYFLWTFCFLAPGFLEQLSLCESLTLSYRREVPISYFSSKHTPERTEEVKETKCL